jgi:hypothetical protein
MDPRHQGPPSDVLQQALSSCIAALNFAAQIIESASRNSSIHLVKYNKLNKLTGVQGGNLRAPYLFCFVGDLSIALSFTLNIPSAQLLAVTECPWWSAALPPKGALPKAFAQTDCILRM